VTARTLRRIDQWVPALHRGDAIGDSARLMRDAFRSWGHEADVWAPDIDDDLAGDGRPYAEFDSAGAGPGDVVILHYALPSRMSEDLRGFPGRRVLLHHNITPPEFFAPWDPEMVRICTLGREQVAGLRGDVDLALADSEFSRRELEEAGFARTGVLPIFLDFARYREAPSPVLLRHLDDERTNLLFVGRLAPNKRQEDLVRLASFWKRFVSPAVRLVLVGRLPRRATLPQVIPEGMGGVAILSLKIWEESQFPKGAFCVFSFGEILVKHLISIPGFWGVVVYIVVGGGRITEFLGI